MTRKRFMKLMMGKGVSRNVVREIVKTMREMDEAEDIWKHYKQKNRLCRLFGVYVRQKQEYAEKSKAKSTNIKKKK